MKKENIGYLLVGVTLLLILTMSMTIDEGRTTNRISGSSGVHLIVPARPASTIYVQGTDKMYKYIKKGYQVQDVIGDPNYSSSKYNYFLMVKY